MKYEIRGGFLFIDGEQVPFVESPNRSGRIVPRSIVEHDTAGPSVESAVNWFSQRRAGASAHFVIGEYGDITQCVPCDRAAWHAGQSSWKGRSGLNGDSIGIEMVSPGRLVRSGNVAKSWWGASYPIEDLTYVETKSHGKGYWKPYSKAQLDANNALVGALCRAYPTIGEVIGHFMIAPGRKIDPTPLFEFAPARAAMRGARQPPAAPDIVTDPESIAEAQRVLSHLGYGAGLADGFIGPRTESAIWAFQKQNGLDANGNLTRETAHLIGSRDTPKLEFPNGHREMVTEKEIVRTSRIAKEADGDKKEGVATLLAGVGLAGVSQVKQASDALSGIVASWGWQAVILTGSAVLICYGWRRYRKALKIIWLRLTDHQTGRHIGGPVQ